MSGHMLREGSTELLEPIYDIITCSINTVTVPVEWKRAYVLPIYKSGDKQKLNYRPLSLTSVMCKIGESIIKNNGLSIWKGTI